jgi:rubrerythrin
LNFSVDILIEINITLINLHNIVNYMFDDPKIINEIQKATKREVDMQKLYEKLYSQAESQNAKILFETLIVEEQKHEVLLKTFLETGDIEVARRKITVFKGDYEICKQIINPSVDTMELRRGMQKAVTLERQAAKIYFDLWDKLNKKEGNLALKDSILTLGREEKTHESMIIREYKEMFSRWEEP